MADLTITATQVLPDTTSAGKTVNGYCGEAITAGAVVYASAGTTYKLADADLSAAAATAIGIALNGGATGQPLIVQTAGSPTIGVGASITDGAVYVLSGTAGKIAPVADLAAADYVTLIGVGNDVDGIDLKIFASGNLIPTP